jgi:hypothetical protein
MITDHYGGELLLNTLGRFDAIHLGHVNVHHDHIWLI